MKNKILIICCFFGMIACTDDSNSRRTLENSGYTDIELHGYKAFACGKDDSFSTAFTAKNPQGKQVSGVVCCGITKGCTVRF